MNTCLVTFDLNDVDEKKTSELYSKAEEFLKSFSDFCKPTKNVYLVKTSKDYALIRDNLKNIIGDNSCILVVGLDGNYASYNYTAINEKIKILLS